MGQVKVLVTFKQNEMWLYDEICKHSAKGNWIKDVLKEHIQNEQKEQKPQQGNIIDEMF